MSVPPHTSKTHLAQENDRLSRRIQDCEDRCNQLRARNQRLISLCLRNSIDPSSSVDGLAWSHTVQPFEAGFQTPWDSQVWSVPDPAAAHLDLRPGNLMGPCEQWAACYTGDGGENGAPGLPGTSLDGHIQPVQGVSGALEDNQPPLFDGPAMCNVDHSSLFFRGNHDTFGNIRGTTPRTWSFNCDSGLYDNPPLDQRYPPPATVESEATSQSRAVWHPSEEAHCGLVQQDLVLPDPETIHVAITQANDLCEDWEREASTASWIPGREHGVSSLYDQPQVALEFRQGFQPIESRGVLDDYLCALKQAIGRLNAHQQLQAKVWQKMVGEGVLWVVREAWPQAEHFFKVTTSFQGFLQSEMWRNFPYKTVYRRMHPAYRPTPTQLCVPHSPIIDWLPWPDLRDKIIACQGEMNVDFVCKAAIENMVAHRRMRPRPRQPNGQKRPCKGLGRDKTAARTSFRVWELCLLEEKAGFRPPQSTDLVYRPRSASVHALEKAYELEYDNFHTQKLHPAFFDEFPSLVVDKALTTYSVQDLPAVRQPLDRDPLGSPRAISHESVARLDSTLSRISEDNALCAAQALRRG